MDLVEQVLAAYHQGANTRREIAAMTGIDVDVVEATVDLLIRTKQIDIRELKTGCQTGGCNGCGDSNTCAPAPGLIQLGKR